MTLNTFITRSLLLSTIALSGLLGYLIFSIFIMTTMSDPIETLQHQPEYTHIHTLPQHVRDAFIVAEDNYFETHHGVDYSALYRAGKILLLTGKKQQGGSTITMQLARNLYLSKEKTFWRKIREIHYAYLLEHRFSKSDIISLYLNKIYFGHGCYGIKQASQYYFGTHPQTLSVAQAATLASLPVAPAKITPLLTPNVVLKKRNLILRRMFALRMITPSTLENALQQPLI